MVTNQIEHRIVNVTAEKLSEHPGIICFINPNHELYHLKVDWLMEQFQNGLKIKLLYIVGDKKPIGYIEYVPGEYCWRPVSAKGYMFIHCLWINGKKHQHQGLGTLLLKEAENEAKDMNGVAAVVSDKSFMATKELFVKNDYKVTSTSGKEQLLVKQYKKGELPSINDWQSELKKHKGLSIVYSKQCPWVARFVEEVKPILKEMGLKPIITELTTPEQAQKAPSLYGVFNLIYDGKLLADRNISITRFKNIIKKEIKI